MNQIASVDLLYPDRIPPLGWRRGDNHPIGSDRVRYVVWVDAGRGHRNGGRSSLGRGQGSVARSLPELAPRQALHLVACRNGTSP